MSTPDGYLRVRFLHTYDLERRDADANAQMFGRSGVQGYDQQSTRYLAREFAAFPEQQARDLEAIGVVTILQDPV